MRRAGGIGPGQQKRTQNDDSLQAHDHRGRQTLSSIYSTGLDANVKAVREISGGQVCLALLGIYILNAQIVHTPLGWGESTPPPTCAHRNCICGKKSDKVYFDSVFPDVSAPEGCLPGMFLMIGRALATLWVVVGGHPHLFRAMKRTTKAAPKKGR